MSEKNFNEYEAIVKEAVEQNKDTFIENSTIEHARVLTVYLLKQANKIIRIFTGTLPELFYTDKRIKESFEEAIKNKRTIQIIVEDKNNIPQYFKNLIKEKKIEIRENNSKNVKNHFFLSGKKAFKVELPHEKNNFNGIRGKANFNNRELGLHIFNIFDELWGKSKLIS